MSEAPHLSVLLDEVTRVLRPAPGELIIDGTFGAGGYARAFLDSGAQVTAFDRDPSARRFAQPLEATGRFKLIEARFSGPIQQPPPLPGLRVRESLGDRLTMELTGALPEVLGWLSAQPLIGLRIEPLGLNAVYYRYHGAIE